LNATGCKLNTFRAI